MEWCSIGTVKGPVVAAVAFFAGALAFVAWVTIQTEVTGKSPWGTTEPGDRSRVYFLDRGECFDAGPAYDERSDVTVLDCDEPHDSEVVRSDTFSTYGSEGDEAVREARDEAEDGCRDEFDAYVDRLPAGSDAELRVYLSGGVSKVRDLGTDEEEWYVGCVAWSPNGRF